MLEGVFLKFRLIQANCFPLHPDFMLVAFINPAQVQDQQQRYFLTLVLEDQVVYTLIDLQLFWMRALHLKSSLTEGGCINQHRSSHKKFNMPSFRMAESLYCTSVWSPAAYCTSASPTAEKRKLLPGNPLGEVKRNTTRERRGGGGR